MHHSKKAYRSIASLRAFPSSQRRGGRAINRMRRSILLRSGRGGQTGRTKHFAGLTTITASRYRARASRPSAPSLRSAHPPPLKELGVTHWPARVSNPFAEREFVACADGVFGYELQALQKQFHHKAAEF